MSSPGVPVVSVYLPASHSSQAATFDCSEYLPVAHGEQVVAPVLVPVFVIEPAAHVVHDATFDAVEYLPAAHAVHVVAPVPLAALVFDPAAQYMQPEESVPSAEYVPAGQAAPHGIHMSSVNG